MSIMWYGWLSSLLSLSHGSMGSLYVHTPTFCGDHTLIHHCYPQLYVVIDQEVWFYTTSQSSTSSWDERKMRLKRRCIKNTYKLISFSNLEIPNNTHPARSACMNMHFQSILHCGSCWHFALHVFSNLCSLTETEPDILLHTWKYWQHIAVVAQELKHSLKKLALQLQWPRGCGVLLKLKRNISGQGVSTSYLLKNELLCLYNSLLDVVNHTGSV